MNTYLRQKFILIGIFIFFYYVIEIIAFLWIGFSVFPRSFLVDFIFVAIVSLPILIIPSHKWSIIYMSVWLFFVNALFVTNANTFNAYFELFTLEQFKLLGEATDILNFTYMSVTAFIVFFVLIGLFVYLMKYLNKNLFIERIQIHKKHYFNVLALFTLLIFSLVMIFSTQEFETFYEYNEDQTLTTLKRESMKRYGLLAYYYKEAELIYFRNEPSDGFKYIYTPNKETRYFGLLEGYNVFTIMIESGEEYAINEVLTPNLYLMMNQGLYLENHYSENKTNVSEVIGMIGHYPPNTFDSLLYDYEFESSLPLILSDQYETAYFHDNYPVFYSRGEIYSMLGFEHLYFHDDLYPDEARWEWDGNLTLDSLTAEKIVENMFVTDDPFYYFWTTLLTHGPYDEGDLNRQKFIDLGYYAQIDQAEANGDWVSPIASYQESDADVIHQKMKYYQAAMMDFDKGLGLIMDALKAQGEYDNTLFVIYGDHTAYYEKFNHIVLDNDNIDEPYYEMELYTTLGLLYNQKLTDTYLLSNNSNRISKVSSPYMIVPTVLDLLGHSYNQNFMIGDSLFNKLEHVFYSHKLTTFFTDRLYSDNGYDIVFQKGIVSDTYLEEFTYQSNRIIEKLQWINDYYIYTRKPKAN
ncbi:sulfatase-like hydrolase/transferase [Hujiaoplasma nucleasis]|uniref:Sulfatase-like hydrolase/transferase n=1 Tax=Hujiaoplasma nucleasis TaxID=2725268 RepID=A0A7L6N3H9_9MOLU|nr:sulfatase-like hydrolase/transferase [Hujiaoplasma nucleasis]QLY39778.1 sulfatase-like hydrolase/transferase [Hujiaoplasma nucleasis]